MLNFGLVLKCCYFVPGRCDFSEILAHRFDDASAPDEETNRDSGSTVQQNPPRSRRLLCNFARRCNQPHADEWSNRVAKSNVMSSLIMHCANIIVTSSKQSWSCVRTWRHFRHAQTSRRWRWGFGGRRRVGRSVADLRCHFARHWKPVVVDQERARLRHDDECVYTVYTIICFTLLLHMLTCVLRCVKYSI